MPPRHTEHYRVYRGRHDELIVSYEEDWELVEKVIPDLQAALTIARRRSPDYIVQVIDDQGYEERRFTPHSYLKSVPKDNPFYVQVKPEGQEIQRFGPMSEVDLWVEDVAEDLQPLYTGVDPTFEEIGQLLRQRRMALGLEQKAVAAMAGISKSAMLDIEHGHSKAPKPTLIHIAKVLNAYFDGNLPSRLKRNPSELSDTEAVQHYRNFHGVEPDRVVDKTMWVPGELVLVGYGQDVGYGVNRADSSKDGWYVHDFGKQVQIWRRARKGERPDKIWGKFPREVSVLGYNIGFTYLDELDKKHEVKGSQKKYLASTPDGKTLVIIGPGGVEFVMKGGDMRVEQWIYD